MHLKNHQCDYMGACRANIDACAAAPILVNTGRLSTACSNSNQCGANSGLECVDGFCLPLDLDTTCDNNGECSTGRCEANVCVLCPGASTCDTAAGPQCCTGLATCDPTTNVCVLTLVDCLIVKGKERRHPAGWRRSMKRGWCWRRPTRREGWMPRHHVVAC
jgi:hypothetical protein